jgi:hypothetical protein
MKKHINITDKEPDRDIRNLFIPLDDQNITYIPLEEMTRNSKGAKKKFRRYREKEFRKRSIKI